MSRFASFRNSPWTAGLVIGLLGWLLVRLSLDPAGSFPALAEGPGITLDESFNVQQGVLLVEALRAYGLFLFDPLNVRDVFGGAGGVPYLPDHPPLGRWWLGFAHNFCWAFFPPEMPQGITSIACARTGSAALFGLNLLLLGLFAGRWFGLPAGWIAPLSVLLMPRVFGHAHIASLETAVNFTYCLALLVLADRWSRGQSSNGEKSDSPNHPPTPLPWTAALWPGFCLGLALLTKIQGILLLPCGVIWGLWYWRKRAVLPLLVWGLVGLAVFFAGWPWLWLDPIGHASRYFGSATDRASLNVFYFGQVYSDTQTPWHYPWVMFLITVPVGLQVLGGLGLYHLLWRQGEFPQGLLILAGMLVPLVLFSLNTAVYDGVRLFLMVFPLWGLCIGYGGQLAWNWLAARCNSQRQWTFATLFFLLQTPGLVMLQPNHLSYYNLLVGGTAGAARLGLETTYWQDSLTRSFLRECADHIPAGATIELAPVLHQFQCTDLQEQAAIVAEKSWHIVPWTPSDSTTKVSAARYILLFHRHADLPPELLTLLTSDNATATQILATHHRGGVPLATLLRIKE